MITIEDNWRTNISCEAVRRLTKTESHCLTCHEDSDNGFDMCVIYTPKGTVSVCCDVWATWINSRDD